MRILLADRNIAHRAGLIETIQSLGHTVVEALASREIIDLCRSKCPDFLLIDATLADLSGLEMIKQIRQLGGAAVWVPIVYMATACSEEEIAQGMEAGADDFLIKPVEPLKLKIKIHSAGRQKSLKEDVFSIAHNLVVANRALESLVTQDLLTDLANSNSFEEALGREWIKAKNAATPLALIFLNIDHFQAFNQKYGVAAGDHCLRRIAATLKGLTPPGETFLARLSGATFALLLPNVTGTAAMGIADRLRMGIETLKIPHSHSGSGESVTLSVGVAVADQDNFTQLIDFRETADYALYQAKHGGHNRCHLATALETI